MLQQNDINNIRFPMVNIRRTSNLAVAPIDNFSLAFMLFMFAAPLMHWCEFRSTTLAVAFACGGICLYILAIYNWYQNKTVLCFFDFAFSFLSLLICYFIYYSEDKDVENIHLLFQNYMIATFFVLYLVALLALAFASKNKGIIHLAYLGLLVLSDIMLIIWLYRFKRKPEKDFHYKRIRKAAGYFMFFASLALWYTGVGKFINDIFQKDMIPLVAPDL